MSDFSKTELALAIRVANGRVKPITLDEIRNRPARHYDDLVLDLEKSQSDPDLEGVALGSNRRVLVAVAVFIVVGALLTLSRLGAEQQVTTVDRATTITTHSTDDPDTLLEDGALAERFAEAFEAFDSGAVEAMLSPDAVDVQFTLTSERDSVEEEFAAWQAVGGRVQFRGCEPTQTDGVFDCIFLVDDKLSRAGGIESLTLPVFVIVDDGQVTSARIRLSVYQPWAQEVWSPFGDWVAVERADQAPIVFPDGLPGLADVSDPEARALYEQMVDDFVKEIGRSSLTEDQP